ncbi:MAG: hypothetical protein ACI8XB_003170 [Patiriisocius sp.]|jgi:hypothetical protein
MEEKKIQDLVNYANNVVKMSLTLISLVFFATILIGVNPYFFSLGDNLEQIVDSENDEYGDRIENGIHLGTGLKDGDGMFVVIANCTNCHSAKLVTQNSMTAERWNETIKWMQETQNLWDLGENQEVIVNYLVKNYPPKKSGNRRANLANIEWYEADN